MAIKFFRDGNRLQVWRYQILPGKYDIVVGNNTIGVVDLSTNTEILEPTSYTELVRENGSPYPSMAAVLGVLDDFFVSVSGATRIPSKFIFASETERDNYFNPNNLDELFAGLNIITNNNLEIWSSTTPATSADYNNANWRSAGSAMTASEIKVLYESNLDTNALTDVKLSILNHLSEVNNRIVSDVSWVFPPGSIFVSENLGIEGAGKAFAVFDVSDDRRGYLVAYERQVNAKPFYRKLLSFNANVDTQIDDSENSLTTQTNTDYTLTENRLITKIVLKSHTTGTADLTLRRGSGQTGMIIASVSGINFTADQEVEINIPQGIFCSNGDIINFEVDGVQMRGATISGSFQFFIKLDNFIFESKNLLDEDDEARFFHTDVSNEINSLTEKTTPVDADLILIEDSADNNSKKKVQISNLPGGSGGTDNDAIHDNVAGEILAITEKTVPANADLLLIEDSEDLNNKKRLQISNLPDENDYVDSVAIGVNNDNTVTLTVGRTGSLVDLNGDFRLLAGNNITLTPNSQNRTITIEATGTQPYHIPTLENFSVDIASRVDVNTDLNVSHTFTWNAHNSANLSSLVIQVTSGTNQTITLPISDGSNSVTFTLSGIDSSVAGSVSFQLVGTDTQSNAVTSNIVTVTIADVQTHQQTHFGTILNTEDQTQIDFATDDIEARENAVGNWVVSGIPSTGLHRIYFAVPTTDNIITRISQSGFTIYDSALTTGNQFTLINNVTISGNTYNVLLLNAAAAVNASYNGQTLTTS